MNKRNETWLDYLVPSALYHTLIGHSLFSFLQSILNIGADTHTDKQTIGQYANPLDTWFGHWQWLIDWLSRKAALLSFVGVDCCGH